MYRIYIFLVRRALDEAIVFFFERIRGDDVCDMSVHSLKDGVEGEMLTRRRGLRWMTMSLPHFGLATASAAF